jgi:putative two-component system response regulator
MTPASDVSILVVDDEPAVRRLAADLLRECGYRCSEAGSESDALAAVEIDAPDLVLTDVTMPGGSGLSLVRVLRERHPDIATVMVTARNDPEVAAAALDGGAYGYVIKPFETNELVIAVAGALRRRTLENENRAHRDRLEVLVGRRTRELDESRAEAVERLARAVESRDAETGSHIERMSGLVYRLAVALGWDAAGAETLRLASVLHDVGKVGIPDEILLKKGPLSADERRIIEAHAPIGHGILAGADSELLRLADTVAWTHHERYDGSGYPRALAGDEIPLVGRIAAVADVFDALTSDRPYRAALPVGEALALIETERGRGFDPEVVDALVGLAGVHERQTNGGQRPVFPHRS